MTDSKEIDWHKRDFCSICDKNIRDTDVHLVVDEINDKKHIFHSIEAKERSEGVLSHD